MDGILHSGRVGGFDAAAAFVSLSITLAIAIAAIVRAPADSRTRTFLASSAAGAVAYAFVALQWVAPQSARGAGIVASTAAAFCLGCAATFHFTQVFPSPRPWIGAHRGWLIAAYVCPPLPAAALAWLAVRLTGPPPGTGAADPGLGAVSDGAAIALVALPALGLLVIVGLVLPLAALMSLVKSWREAKDRRLAAARVTTGWMLISQMAGGVLTVLVVPLLALAGVAGLWLHAVSAMSYGSALLMPLAFAAAVWKYGMLEADTAA